MKNKSYEWKSTYDCNYIQFIKMPVLITNKLKVILEIIFTGGLNILIPTDWLSKKGLKEIDRILRGRIK